jgi:SAM-dependent methyltransferase
MPRGPWSAQPPALGNAPLPQGPASRAAGPFPEPAWLAAVLAPRGARAMFMPGPLAGHRFGPSDSSAPVRGLVAPAASMSAASSNDGPHPDRSRSDAPLVFPPQAFGYTQPYPSADDYAHSNRTVQELFGGQWREAGRILNSHYPPESIAHLRPGDRVLDIGCGPQAVLVHHLRGLDIHAEGIDPYPYTDKGEGIHIMTLQDYMRRRGADDAAFNLVVTTGGPFLYEGPAFWRPTLQAIDRLLADDGRVLIGVVNRSASERLESVVEWESPFTIVEHSTRKRYSPSEYFILMKKPSDAAPAGFPYPGSWEVTIAGHTVRSDVTPDFPAYLEEMLAEVEAGQGVHILFHQNRGEVRSWHMDLIPRYENVQRVPGYARVTLKRADSPQDVQTLIGRPGSTHLYDGEVMMLSEVRAYFGSARACG